MSYEPSGLSGHHAGELNRGYPNTGNSFNPSSIINGGHTSTPNEVERKRNYKLLIDPVLKGRGHQKIYRFDGDFEGQPPVIPKDPRSRRTRLWSTRTKADLPVPKFKIDKFYVGIPPQRDIILNGLNDNVDRKFLHQLCEKFGNIEGIKIFYDPLTKRHLGKARVGFTTSASAKLAVAKLDATSIMGCIVHADLEHKVEIKPQVKTQVSQHGTNAVGKTPPSLERITGHHMLPTPPPSASSHSPANSTPSTPGSLGLTDPRTRGHSTSSASTEKLQSASPSVWPRNTVHQSNQSTCKGPVFEPISPPCEKIALPPPPPPDIPPPSLPSKRRTSSSPVSSGMRQPHLQDPGDRCQDTALKHGKDVKGYNNRSVWESCKTNRQSDKEFEWRRRDRDADRNRSEHSLFRSRWSTDKKGNDFYPEKDLRYSGSKDYTSRGRPGGETRDGLGRSELKKSTSRDDEGKRCRDSISSCNSEKSEKGFKSRFADTSRSMNADGDQTKVGVHEKCKKSNIRSTTPVNEKSESVLKSTTSLNKDNVHTLQGAVSSSANALVNMSSSLENNATGTEKLLNADKLDREPFLSQDGLDLAGQNTKQESSSTSDNLKVHHDNLAERILGKDGRADGGGDVSQSRDLSGTNVTSAETINEQPTAGSGFHKDVGKVTDADAAEGASNLSMPEPEMKIESGQESLIKGDLGYYPVVEDISPVSSPTAAKASPRTYPTVIPDHSAMTSGDSQVVSTEDMPVNKEEKEITEDNDDAMSLSSISSNEETFEVTEPGSKPITVPPSVPFPPPFVPSVPPPPFIPPFDPTVPPPSITAITILPPPLPITVPPPTIPPPPIQTLAPPHPLVPPSFHPTFRPQFVSSLGVVPPPPAQGQYQTHPSGQVPSTHDQRPPMKKKWKAKISEEVLRIVSEELGVILKRDVNKRLVENSAFKALDGWWDNLGKSKLKMTTHQDYASTNQSSLLTTSGQNDMTSSPFFSTSMNQSEGLGIGLRASLPKMPSFRKRHQPSNGGSELYAKRRKEDSSSEAGSKTDLTGSDSETCSHKESGDSFQVKRRRAGDQLNSEDSCVSPWQQAEDSMDGPPATSVRTEEKHPTVGSSLYTNIYSSFSDSGSSMSEEESDSENSGEGQSEWDESEDSDVTSESASDYSSDEGPAKTSGDQTSEIVSGIPRTPPGTPPETPPETPPAISPIPRTPSITPPASPVDSQLSTIEEFPELEEPKVEEGQESMNMEGYLESDVVTRDDLETITDSADYSSEKERVPGTPDLAMSVSEGDDKGLSRDETQNESLDDDIEDHSDQKEESVSLEKTEFEENLTPSQLVDQPSLSTKETEDREISVTEDKTPEQSYKPVVELPPEFSLRRYEQDDQLVWDFLISGLDYEDASYLKIGFENLVQVGSDSVANAHWAFHPTTSAGVSNKGRKQKCDNIGVRIHSSGSARCEGYYKIGMAEKAKYLEAARRQLDRTQAVDNKKAEEKEANKAKQQSRENRALQRRLAASFQYEDFGDILKFNQLKVRKKKLTFRKSCIHDWGLFALEPIGPDEMVIEYVGEVVRQAIADDREKRYERCGIGSSYLFRVDSDTIIDATKYGNLARFINHCCEPNCYAKVVTLESEKKIVIYSKRDIAVNEEITYDYKFPIEEDKIPCLCGAPQCRGTLN